MLPVDELTPSVKVVNRVDYLMFFFFFKFFIKISFIHERHREAET